MVGRKRSGSAPACHGFKLVSSQGMSRVQSDETLTWMPDIQGADRDLILDHLAQHYPSRAGGFKNPFAPR